jgi:uncharacterized membrane protein YbaN (DUF454 family)
MEYQIYNNLRNKYRIPYFLRFILAIICLLLGILWIILPIIPWILFLIIWIILIIPWERIRDLIKIRKSFIYMILHFREKRIIRQKVFDILRHSRDISFWRRKNKFKYFKKYIFFKSNNWFKRFFN